MCLLRQQCVHMKVFVICRVTISVTISKIDTLFQMAMFVGDCATDDFQGHSVAVVTISIFQILVRAS